MFEYLRHCKNEKWQERADPWKDYLDNTEDDEDFDDFAEDDQAGRGDARRGRPAKAFDMLRWQESVWAQAPVEGGVSLAAFLDYHMRVSLPRPTGGSQGDPKFPPPAESPSTGA